MTESYEQLRESATGKAWGAWKAADREESNLRTLYRTLKENPRDEMRLIGHKNTPNVRTAEAPKDLGLMPVASFVTVILAC
jgi:hypothetical protein